MPLMIRTTLNVRGLSCEKCQALVESKLKELEGTDNVSVTLLPMQATLSYDPSVISANEIEAAITNNGKGFSVV